MRKTKDKNRKSKNISDLRQNQNSHKPKSIQINYTSDVKTFVCELKHLFAFSPVNLNALKVYNKAKKLYG